MASQGPPLERWLEHKAQIYHCYIIEDKTLTETMATLRDVHRFYASKNQYTAKLKAWGFRKYNQSTLYPRIEGSLKRKQIDLDAVLSVTMSAPTGDKLIPYKKLKKALGRSNKSEEHSVPLADAPSPPGLRVQYRPQARNFDLGLHHYPCISFITELSNVLMKQQTFLSRGPVPQQTHNNRCVPSLNKTSLEMAKSLNVNSIDGCPKVPPSFNYACKSLGLTQQRDLKLLFQAMFLVSNNQLGPKRITKFREWLAKNIDVSDLCRMQLWAAKILLTHLLHGAAEMDDVTILRAAHTAGADFDRPSSSGPYRSLLQHSLSYNSVQCARYLINAGANVGGLGNHQKATEASEDAILEWYSITPLGIASRSHQCVELIPALLARGASPRGMLLLSACVRSGATCDTIKALLCAGVSPNEGGALSAAASLGRCDVMEVLLLAGASVEGWCELQDVRLLDFVDVRSPAVAAAGSKCIEVIELLIRHCIDLNASWLDNFSQDVRASLFHQVQIYGRVEESDKAWFHPMQAAVGTGDCGFVEFMIGKGACLLSKYGHPLLVLAAQKSDVAMMTFLLERGADANMISGNGPAVSALEAAARRGCLPGMRLLLNAGADLNLCSQRPGSHTPLQRAAECREVAAVDLLLANGADIRAPPCPVGGVSTLQALIKCGKLELVVRALAAGAPVNDYPSTVGSPLLTAISEENVDLVSLLLRLGADDCYAAEGGDDVLEDSCLPLQLAAWQGHLEICKVLVDNGADIDGVVSKNNERTPLALACEEGNESVVEYLIARNACLYGKTTFCADTPLWSALSRQDAEIVLLLLESGVDANHFCGEPDQCGCRNDRLEHSTPLIQACEGDGMLSDEDQEETSYDLATLLIEYGAEVNLRPSLDHNTPLQVACLKGEVKLAKLLLSHGADVNAPCSVYVEYSRLVRDLGVIPTGFNALQAAISQQNVGMVDLLLSRGANVHLAASSTMIFTALQTAASGNLPIVERLLKAGASVDEPPSKPNGRTAIQRAAGAGRLELLGLLLHHYKGPRIAEICDDAIVFAHKYLQDHVVGFLRDYKEQHARSSVVEGPEVVEIDDWID